MEVCNEARYTRAERVATRLVVKNTPVKKLPGTLAEASPASVAGSVCRVPKSKHYSSGIPKVALIVLSAQWVGKSRQQIVNLGRLERNHLINRDVEPATELHRTSVPRR